MCASILFQTCLFLLGITIPIYLVILFTFTTISLYYYLTRQYQCSFCPNKMDSFSFCIMLFEIMLLISFFHYLCIYARVRSNIRVYKRPFATGTGSKSQTCMLLLKKNIFMFLWNITENFMNAMTFYQLYGQFYICKIKTELQINWNIWS